MMTASDETKAKLKRARELRGKTPEWLTELVKENNRVQTAILGALAKGPLTVPQMAETTQLETNVVFWHVNALRKYNKIHDVKKSGDYFVYERK